jgi:hypothetical protein
MIRQKMLPPKKLFSLNLNRWSCLFALKQLLKQIIIAGKTIAATRFRLTGRNRVGGITAFASYLFARVIIAHPIFLGAL